jgi:hypothetical protein
MQNLEEAKRKKKIIWTQNLLRINRMMKNLRTQLHI